MEVHENNMRSVLVGSASQGLTSLELRALYMLREFLRKLT